MSRFLVVLAGAALLMSCAATVMPLFGSAMGIGQ